MSAKDEELLTFWPFILNLKSLLRVLVTPKDIDILFLSISPNTVHESSASLITGSNVRDLNDLPRPSTCTPSRKLVLPLPFSPKKKLEVEMRHHSIR